MKEYIITEKDIEYLKKALESPWSLTNAKKNYPESLMLYTKICSCDDGYFCEHRLKWLIDYIENKELKTRKTKLKKLKNEL